MPIAVVIDEGRPEVVELSLVLPRSAVEAGTIEESLPELQQKLASQWPVKGIALTYTNPFNPSQLGINVVIGLVTWIAKPFAEKMREEAYRWLQRRFKGVRKRTRAGTKIRKHVRRPASEH